MYFQLFRAWFIYFYDGSIKNDHHKRKKNWTLGVPITKYCGSQYTKQWLWNNVKP
jgi:hypothetical protein